MRPGQSEAQEPLELQRVEGPPGTIDEAGNAIFLGLRNMVTPTIQLLVPQRMPGRLCLAEKLCVENRGEW
jgi:hypothetical protein